MILAGLIGGQIVLALLANGTPPEAIRIVDTRKPVREKFSQESDPASKVAIVEADITTEAGALGGFAAPWPEETAKLPLTVFHTVGVIRPQERSRLFWDRVARVNVTGTAHVLAAARKAGAGVLIFTSSSAVENREVGWFPPPWRRYPSNFIQYLSCGDFKNPLRPDSQFPTNYALSKALAERLVCDADGGPGGGMRTGAIRPGNTVYGHKDDLVIGQMLALNWVPSFNAAWVQNWVHSGNIALAHLGLEGALLGDHADKVAGRPFLVTDEGPAVEFNDTYKVMSATCVRGFTAVRPPPLLLLANFYVIEAWAVLGARFPALRRVIGEPKPPIDILQPGTAMSGVTSIVDDSDAKRAPKDGGFGYRPVCTTVEGLCELVGTWNERAVREEMEAVKSSEGNNSK